jgi:hypothetical protein
MWSLIAGIVFGFAVSVLWKQSYKLWGKEKGSREFQSR